MKVFVTNIEKCNTDDIICIKNEKETFTIRVRDFIATKCFCVDTNRKLLTLTVDDDHITEEDNKLSQFLFNKYEDATQEISRLSEELEYMKTRNRELANRLVECTAPIRG